jgi:V8-like Glu-specific endopeptidase
MRENGAGNQGAASGHQPVSNLPPDANRSVEVTEVTLPATQGINPNAAEPTAFGLEPVAGHTEAVAFGGPEAAMAGPPVPAPAELAADLSGLEDIGVASFGSGVLERVIGTDERTQITDTVSYPWRSIASLLITAKDNSRYIGTGWFVSPRTLLTAGHCVYINGGNPATDGWVKQIQVMCGRNGSTLPYGSVTSTVFKSVDGWTQDGNENFDFGAIIVPTPLGESVGMFGIAVYPDDELLGQSVNISGYPGDKPDGTQWFDSRAVAQVNARKVYYEADTAGGQSGAPVFRIVDGNRIGVAVHAYGGATANSGTRINDEVYGWMKSWME